MDTADAPATPASLPSSPAPEPVVWICAHVEQMAETTDYLAIPRAEWDAMTPAEREQAVDNFGAETMSGAGGYGASVVDEDDVPEDAR
jgi:hypothetical protein